MPSADSPTPPPSGRAATADDLEQTTTLSLRRAPRVPVFLITGAVLGLIAGIFAGALGSGNVNFTTAQVIGYMATIGGLLGLALGALVYVIADRLSVKRAHEVQAYAEHSPGHRDEPSANPTTDREAAAESDREADRQTDRPVDRRTGRQADRPADVED